MLCVRGTAECVTKKQLTLSNSYAAPTGFAVPVIIAEYPFLFTVSCS